MEYIKLPYANAFLLGEGASVEADLQPKFPYLRFETFETVGGNLIAVPYSRFADEPQPRVIYYGMFSDPHKWPVVPLVRHRGGFFTGTARHYLEGRDPWVGRIDYVDPAGNGVRMKGNLPKTAYRVVWANRKESQLVFDVLRKPHAS